MNVLLAGASGFVGRALVPALRAGGHDVRTLVRRRPAVEFEREWQPSAGGIGAADVAWADAVINLAGENVAAGRWTASRKRRLCSSRLDTTGTLARALAEAGGRGRVLLNASAVGFYGDRGDDWLPETAAPGGGFLSELCRDWEAATRPAEEAGVRVVRLRLGMVLGGDGGALARMLPFFRLGLGGRLGDGLAWMSWIEIGDLTRLIGRIVSDERWSGAVNAVSPGPVRNGEFNRALARRLRRPAVFPVPEFLLRLAFGKMAEEVLLASLRARPERLEEAGFPYLHPTLERALEAHVRSS